MDNDQRIIKLRNQIEIKKEKIGDVLKLVPLTNCSLELDGERFNLHTLQKDPLTLLLIKLNLYKMSAVELKVGQDFKIGGYLIEEWMIDIEARLKFLANKDEKLKLRKMEDKLKDMLSDNKKVELEIDEIENLLK